MGVRAEGSRRGRAWTVVAIAVVAVLAFVLAGASRDFPPVAARYFNLPDGKAQISVSSPNKHDIVVRWRDPSGMTWTDPEVVFRDDDRMLTSMRIRVGGPTLALFATFTPPDTYDDEESAPEERTADDVTAFVVCRDGSCSASREYPATLDEPPQVTPDGAHVLLAEMDGVYVAWHGADIVEQQPSGLPEGGTYGERQPLLAPDGSLRAVHGVPVPDGCDFTLLTTETGEAAYSEAARHLIPGDRRDGCTTTLETFSSAYVVVVRSTYDVWFLARTGATWSRVTQDPSGQVRYPRPGWPTLAGAYVRTGFWHWREAVASSPDGRTLVVQLHFPGEETWGPPQVVASAPKGSRCIYIDPMPTYTHGEEDPFSINLRCRSRPSPSADWVYSYPTAVTDDGKTWHSFQATAAGVRVGNDLFFRGRPSYRWSPESGLQRVHLPVPHGSAMTLLGDGTSALSSLVESGDGCTVEVRLAGPDDTEWSAPLPSTADPIPLSMCTLDQVQGENRNVYHYFGRTATQLRTVRLVWRDGEPIVENGPS